MVCGHASPGRIHGSLHTVVERYHRCYSRDWCCTLVDSTGDGRVCDDTRCCDSDCTAVTLDSPRLTSVVSQGPIDRQMLDGDNSCICLWTDVSCLACSVATATAQIVKQAYSVATATASPVIHACCVGMVTTKPATHLY